MTIELANACGADAANSQMRKEGHEVWNEADYNLAALTTARIAVDAGLAPPEHLEAMA